MLAGFFAALLAVTLTPAVASATHGDHNEPRSAEEACPEGTTQDHFTDDENSTFEDEINCIAEFGVTVGGPGNLPDSQYGPGLNVSRAQMASFIMRKLDLVEGYTRPANSPNAFPDDDTNTHHGNINDAAAEDIAEGFEDGTFRPGNAVTRGQMASFLVRQLRTAGADIPENPEDAFPEATGSAHHEDLNILHELGIYVGRNDGTSGFAEPIRREQMAALLVRDIGYLVEQGLIEPLGDGTVAQAVTVRPELTSARIVETVAASTATPTRLAGTYVIYTFDEPIGQSLATNFVNFHVYRTDGSSESGSGGTVQPGNREVEVRFANLDTAASAATLTVATVDKDAVFDANGLGNPEGDAAIGTASGSTLAAGQTAAPDLVSVQNFRQSATIGQTAVDFTFDEGAFVVDTTGFTLVTTANQLVQCTASTAAGSPSGGTVPGGSGTTTITVVCDNPGGAPGSTAGTLLTSANVARGAVEANTVQDSTGVQNPLQTADVASGGNTSGPDLVSATFTLNETNDQIVYTFDEAVNAAPTAADFNAYLANGGQIDGTGTPQISTTNPSQVRVDFGATGLDTAVGASVDPTAVTSTATGDQNERDEVGVANSSSTTVTPGRTSGPDLTGVALTASDGFTAARAQYTFDENVATTGLSDTLFFLYLADGTMLPSTDCARGTTSATTDATADSATVTCEFSGATNTQVINATLGTVDDGAVQDSTSTMNPEGAEPTSGGTGTPAN